MSDPIRIIVADDEPNLRRVLAAILAREGYRVLQASDGDEALRLLDPSIAAIITDLRMPKVDGMTVLRQVVARAPDVPVIILTAHGSVDSAVEAVKAGAFDYIEKPFEQEQIRSVVAKAVMQSEAEKRAPRLQLEEDESGDGSIGSVGSGSVVGRGSRIKGRFGLVGASAGMRQLFAILEKVADTPSTV
ncbi:MAG: response regulator, partial [Pseudomonadota bacterium]